jgi:ribosomal protein L29
MIVQNRVASRSLGQCGDVSQVRSEIAGVKTKSHESAALRKPLLAIKDGR